MSQTIHVGHSPDPDDAFMFYALAHDKLDTGDLIFRHELQDIETLNRRALRGELEVTAVSIHAYASLLDQYALLPSGCSMGDRYGPMVVARRPMALDELTKARIASVDSLAECSRKPPISASACASSNPTAAWYGCFAPAIEASAVSKRRRSITTGLPRGLPLGLATATTTAQPEWARNPSAALSLPAKSPP